MDKEVMLALMKVLMSLKTLSGDSIVGICGRLQTNEEAKMFTVAGDSKSTWPIFIRFSS